MSKENRTKNLKRDAGLFLAAFAVSSAVADVRCIFSSGRAGVPLSGLLKTK